MSIFVHLKILKRSWIYFLLFLRLFSKFSALGVILKKKIIKKQKIRTQINLSKCQYFAITKPKRNQKKLNEEYRVCEGKNEKNTKK